jgi:hypothetical protein
LVEFFLKFIKRYLSIYKSIELSKTGRINETAEFIQNETILEIFQFLKNYGETEKKKFCLFRLLSLLGQIIVNSEKKRNFMLKNNFFEILLKLSRKENELMKVFCFKLLSFFTSGMRNMKSSQLKTITELFISKDVLDLSSETLKELKPSDSEEMLASAHYIFICYFDVISTQKSEKEQEKITETLSSFIEISKKWINCQIKTILSPVLDFLNFVAKIKNGKEFCEKLKITSEIIEILKTERDPKILCVACSYLSSAITTEEVALKYCSDEVLLTRIMSLIVTRGYPTAGDVNFCAYAALSSVLIGSSEETISTLHQMGFTDVVVRDLANTNLGLRYGAIVSIRAIALYADTNSSSIFRALIESKVFDMMWNTFSQDLVGKSTDPYQEWFQKRVEQFVKQGTLCAMNSLIQSITVDGDEKNVHYINELLTKNEKFRELVKYLAEMEKQKKTSKSSPKFLIFLVLALVAILVLLPIIYSRVGPKK